MIGQTFAHYEITAKLGQGGMGEVYRARDTKLGRDVAIKILPRELSEDPERIARFEREARVLASLQHSNIASIYGFENLPNARFLVMELVEGEDLSEHMAQGPLSVQESIEIASQIAQGLEAAHDQGIVHRDLKPANVKITADGQVKVLDFGLARAYVGDVGDEPDPQNSPTITAAMTQVGTILGTAAYMSPEQARGRPVDQRTDIWSLGVILTEMLTGKRVFEEETVSDTLAAVLRADLSEEFLPPDLPSNLRRVLGRCLERDRRKRMRSAGDVWLELSEEESVTAAATEETTGSRNLFPLALVALALAIAAAGWFLRPSSRSETARPTHVSIALPEGYQFVSRDKLPLGAPQPCVDISRDGRLILSVIENQAGTMLYRRGLDVATGEIIPGTEGAYHPRISPDGTRITFLSDTTLKRVDVDGHRATPIVDLVNPFGQDWYDDQNVLVVTQQGSALVLVNVQTNAVTPILDATYRIAWPEAVPGLEAVLLSQSHVAKNDETEADPIVVQWLDGSRQDVLGVQGTLPRFHGDDLLLFVRDGALMASPFVASDPTRPHSPRTVLEGLIVESSIGHYAISDEGTLVYVEGDWLVGKSLVWDDGQGPIRDLGFPSLGYGDFELSPDGRKVAITIGSANSSIWMYDVDRGTRSRLATEGVNRSVIWSPDGSRVAYASREGEQRSVKIQTVGSNAAPKVLLTSGETIVVPHAWHAEVGIVLTRMGESHDIFRIDPDQPQETETIVSGAAAEWGPDISPSGKWMVYTSDETGRYEIYARGLAPGSRSWPVSVDGGEEPIWNSDGTAIFFRNGSDFLRTEILEASDDGLRFRAAVPEVRVTGAYSNVPGISYDVGPDDKSLLLLKTEGGTERPSHLNVIFHFDEIIAERMR